MRASDHLFKRIDWKPIRFSLSSLITLLILLLGCGDDREEEPYDGSAGTGVLIDSSSTRLMTLHPVLDRNVRRGDSMLIDLHGLIQEGVITEGDMELIGFYVRALGGLNDPDSSLSRKSYRELIRESLFSDLSDPTEDPCEGCDDSLIIYFPENNGKIYFGMGKKSLQEMIEEALAAASVLSEFRKPPYDRRIDSAGWTNMMDHLYSQRKSNYDPIIFGNTLIYLSRNEEKLGDYTYGQILSVVERVKEMPEFERLGQHLDQLAAEESNSESPGAAAR